MDKTLVLLGEKFEVKNLTKKQGDIFDRLNNVEYFYTTYSFRREQVLNEIRRDIKNNKVDYKSISMKDIERVISLVNDVVGYWGL